MLKKEILKPALCSLSSHHNPLLLTQGSLYSLYSSGGWVSAFGAVGWGSLVDEATEENYILVATVGAFGEFWDCCHGWGYFMVSDAKLQYAYAILGQKQENLILRGRWIAF